MSGESSKRGSYERHAPDLPRRYSVFETSTGGKHVTLAAPALDAIGAEVGDEVTVRRNDAGDVVLEADHDDGRDEFVPASDLADWVGDDDE